MRKKRKATKRRVQNASDKRRQAALRMLRKKSHSKGKPK